MDRVDETRSGPKRPAAEIGGGIFRDILLTWTHFVSLSEENLLTEKHPDFFRQILVRCEKTKNNRIFFRQILRGCFCLHMASEAKSDLTNGFVMANNPFLPPFGVLTLALFAFLNSFVRRLRRRREPTVPRPAS